ncbi:unnamed protein product [Miscanthus lutarioriparius]|uniref:Zinc finger GRF-type domain-containing protein n=1 Tax=Miscanthus lutarioriparius TaxID=422564 RepID=A0A811MRC0_9POAL|nr:unnamed protein product [Miscanthus lutarioriparius]
MAQRMEPSSSRSMASWAIEEEDTEKETRLPLIMCPTCKRERERVIKLIVRTTENGNQGRMFFKCPRNVPGMTGRCRFYEFQKAYLKKLMELKFVVIDLEAGLGAEEVEEAWGFGEEEAQSKCAGKNSMEAKMDALISLLKMLVLVLFVICIVAIMYVFK